MAQRLHETEIADKIVDLINTTLGNSMGLKVVMMGALEFYPALETLSDHVPAVFIKPSPSTELERITTAQTYQIVYNFRIVFVKKFAANEEIVRQKVIETQKIAELLLDQVNLSGLVLTNGQIMRTNLRAIEWEPAEDSLVASINAEMTAAAMTFTVVTTSRKDVI